VRGLPRRGEILLAKLVLGPSGLRSSAPLDLSAPPIPVEGGGALPDEALFARAAELHPRAGHSAWIPETCLEPPRVLSPPDGRAAVPAAASSPSGQQQGRIPVGGRCLRHPLGLRRRRRDRLATSGAGVLTSVYGPNGPRTIHPCACVLPTVRKWRFFFSRNDAIFLLTRLERAFHASRRSASRPAAVCRWVARLRRSRGVTSPFEFLRQIVRRWACQATH
jgi:hypothetical protein